IANDHAVTDHDSVGKQKAAAKNGSVADDDAGTLEDRVSHNYAIADYNTITNHHAIAQQDSVTQSNAVTKQSTQRVVRLIFCFEAGAGREPVLHNDSLCPRERLAGDCGVRIWRCACQHRRSFWRA